LLSAGDAGVHPFVFQRVPEPVGVIAAIADRAAAPPFVGEMILLTRGHTGRGRACLQISRADHCGLSLAVPTVGIRGVPPAQPIAIDVDNPAQHPFVIDPRLAVRFWVKGGKPGHLLAGQPTKAAHVSVPFSKPRITQRWFELAAQPGANLQGSQPE